MTKRSKKNVLTATKFLCRQQNMLFFCSAKCLATKKRQEKIDAWLKDPDTGTVKGRGLSNTIRQYLIEQAGFVCSKPDCTWG